MQPYLLCACLSSGVVSQSAATSDPLGAVGGDADDKLFSDSDDCSEIEEIRRRRVEHFSASKRTDERRSRGSDS